MRSSSVVRIINPADSRTYTSHRSAAGLVARCRAAWTDGEQQAIRLLAVCDTQRLRDANQQSVSDDHGSMHWYLRQTQVSGMPDAPRLPVMQVHRFTLGCL